MKQKGQPADLRVGMEAGGNKKGVRALTSQKCRGEDGRQTCINPHFSPQGTKKERGGLKVPPLKKRSVLRKEQAREIKPLDHHGREFHSP